MAPVVIKKGMQQREQLQPIRNHVPHAVSRVDSAMKAAVLAEEEAMPTRLAVQATKETKKGVAVKALTETNSEVTVDVSEEIGAEAGC